MTPEARHLEVLRILAGRPNGQADAIRQCLPPDGKLHWKLYVQSLAELIASAHVIQLDGIGASASGLARFNLTAKGRRAIRESC